MAQEIQIGQVLQWIPQPAFWAADGIIRQLNAAAAACLLREGECVSELLRSGQEEYAAMEKGSLFLSLQIGEETWDACVHRMSEGDLCLLESSRDPVLRAMSLSAMKLREPLNALMSELEQLLPELADGGRAGRINRRTHQLLRILGNMSSGNGRDVSTMELREVCGLLDEIFEKAAALAEPLNITVDWSVPDNRVYTVVDADKLERAVYNMLSNALKASVAGDRITAKVLQKGNRLLICVTDGGSGIGREELTSVYTRYLRDPGPESPDKGVGLGMRLITDTARLHGGTVLLETPPDGGTRVTMTLAIHQNWGGLRTSTLPVDYTGGLDHALVELSDVLPSSAYEY